MVVSWLFISLVSLCGCLCPVFSSPLDLGRSGIGAQHNAPLGNRDIYVQFPTSQTSKPHPLLGDTGRAAPANPQFSTQLPSLRKHAQPQWSRNLPSNAAQAPHLVSKNSHSREVPDLAAAHPKNAPTHCPLNRRTRRSSRLNSSSITGLQERNFRTASSTFSNIRIKPTLARPGVPAIPPLAGVGLESCGASSLAGCATITCFGSR